jgi:hypothetical protein
MNRFEFGAEGKAIQTLPHSAGVSYRQALWQPTRSAISTCSGVSGPVAKAREMSTV